MLNSVYEDGLQDAILAEVFFNSQQPSKQEISTIAGYDPSMFIKKDEANKYLCTICQHVCQNAIDIGCGNQHIFCSNCIKMYYQYSSNDNNDINNNFLHLNDKTTKCPSCQLKVKESTTYKLPFVDRLVSQLHVKCPNKITHKQLNDLNIDGDLKDNNNDNDNNDNNNEFWKISMECQWIGELGSLQYHSKNCKYQLIECELCLKKGINDGNTLYKTARGLMKYHIINCPYAPTMCINGCSQLIMKKDLQIHIDHNCPETMIECINHQRGCNQNIKRKNMSNHRKTCQYELVICEYCTVSIKRMDLNNHYNKCQLFPIQCINDGCNEIMQRKLMEFHQLNECPEKVVNCPIDGCDVTLKRKYLQDHESTSCDYILVHCVYCKSDILRKNFAKHTNDECDLIPIECPIGCGKMIQKKNVQFHREHNCLEYVVKCTNGSCDETMKRKYLSHHYNVQCQYTLIKCKYCNKTQKLRKNMELHFEKCMFYKVKCTKNCGKLIMRKNLKNHLENECDEIMMKCSNHSCSVKLKKKNFNNHVYHKCRERMIDCNYRKYGCDYRCKAKNLEQHLEESELLHFKLETKYQINEMKTEMNKIIQVQAQQNTELKEKVLHLQRKLNEECTSNWIIVFESDKRNISHIKCVDIKKKKYEDLTCIDTHHIWRWNGDSSYCITDPLDTSYFVGYNGVYDNSLYGDDDYDDYNHKNRSRVIYRVGGCNCDIVDNIAYRLDKYQSWKLPQLNTKRWAHKIVYSKYHGLLCVGGTKFKHRASLTTCLNSVEQLKISHDTDYDDDDAEEDIEEKKFMEHEDDQRSVELSSHSSPAISGKITKDKGWQYLLPMHSRRHNPSSCLITEHSWMEERENLIVTGGWYNNDDLRSSELYSFSKNKWIALNTMLFKHQSGGICEWKLKNHNIIMVGGWGEYSRNKAEEYNPEKNQWYELPNTLYNHRFNPCLSIYNDIIPSTYGILIVIGDYPCNSNINDWGHAEFYDPRMKKWQIIDSVANLCGYNHNKTDLNDIKSTIPISHTILPPVF